MSNITNVNHIYIYLYFGNHKPHLFVFPRNIVHTFDMPFSKDVCFILFVNICQHFVGISPIFVDA